MIKFNKTNLALTNEEISQKNKMATAAFQELVNGSGSGNDFLGWIEKPSKIKNSEIDKIKKVAADLQTKAKHVIVIGIGGSYLGSKAALDFLLGEMYNHLLNTKIWYAGNNLSERYLKDITKIIGKDDFAIIVISKSGTTLEPAIAFRYFKEMLDKKYGVKARERVIAITDPKTGALRRRAETKKHNWTNFAIEDNIGGRFSLLTPAGLLPLAVAGIDIENLIAGSIEAQTKLNNNNFDENIAMQYAAIRHNFLEKGKHVEIMATYDPELVSLTEWFKQLFGESEGKDQKGILPTSNLYTQDLHSLGQYVQDGGRFIFQTVIKIKNNKNGIKVIELKNNDDQLNYLSGKNLATINNIALDATAQAHENGGTPSLIIEIQKRDAKTFGYLTQFYMMSCGISAYMLGVNPFNQPGVEDYKTEMFKRLKK